jgi:hypothetical protein
MYKYVIIVLLLVTLLGCEPKTTFTPLAKGTTICTILGNQKGIIVGWSYLDDQYLIKFLSPDSKRHVFITEFLKPEEFTIKGNCK